MRIRFFKVGFTSSSEYWSVYFYGNQELISRKIIKTNTMHNNTEQYFYFCLGKAIVHVTVVGLK